MAIAAIAPIAVTSRINRFFIDVDSLTTSPYRQRQGPRFLLPGLRAQKNTKTDLTQWSVGCTSRSTSP